MKLLSVIHGPTFGGAHNQALRLAEPLRRRGVETLVALPRGAEEAAGRLREGGVEVTLLPLSRLRATADPRPNLRLLRAARSELQGLRDLIASERIDVVQAHGPVNPQAALAARGGERDAAVVWQLLDTRTPPALRRLSMPLLIRRADVVASWGAALADLHPGTRSLGERWRVVYPPVVASDFEPDPDRRAEARERLGVGPGEPLVVAVGVLTPQKGHEHLIRAIGLLAAEGIEVKARVLGAPSPAHPEYLAGLERESRRLGLEADRTLALVDPRGEVPLLLQAADIFAMSSVRRSEGMPTAILEAMCAGKPVVATDVGAVGELVSEGESGLLAEPERPDRLAAALRHLITDAGARRRMGDAGRRTALERFDLERLADLHLGALELAIEHRRARVAGRRDAA